MGLPFGNPCACPRHNWLPKIFRLIFIQSYIACSFKVKHKASVHLTIQKNMNIHLRSHFLCHKSFFYNFALRISEWRILLLINISHHKSRKTPFLPALYSYQWGNIRGHAVLLNVPQGPEYMNKIRIVMNFHYHLL
ncbi:hypothetical protein ES703_64070 [subsurface metagenome]